MSARRTPEGQQPTAAEWQRRCANAEASASSLRTLLNETRAERNESRAEVAALRAQLERTCGFLAAALEAAAPAPAATGVAATAAAPRLAAAAPAPAADKAGAQHGPAAARAPVDAPRSAAREPPRSAAPLEVPPPPWSACELCGKRGFTSEAQRARHVSARHREAVRSVRRSPSPAPPEPQAAPPAPPSRTRAAAPLPAAVASAPPAAPAATTLPDGIAPPFAHLFPIETPPPESRDAPSSAAAAPVAAPVAAPAARAAAVVSQAVGARQAPRSSRAPQQPHMPLQQPDTTWPPLATEAASLPSRTAAAPATQPAATRTADKRASLPATPPPAPPQQAPLNSAAPQQQPREQLPQPAPPAGDATPAEPAPAPTATLQAEQPAVEPAANAAQAEAQPAEGPSSLRSHLFKMAKAQVGALASSVAAAVASPAAEEASDPAADPPALRALHAVRDTAAAMAPKQAAGNAAAANGATLEAALQALQAATPELGAAGERLRHLESEAAASKQAERLKAASLGAARASLAAAELVAEKAEQTKAVRAAAEKAAAALQAEQRRVDAQERRAMLEQLRAKEAKSAAQAANAAKSAEAARAALDAFAPPLASLSVEQTKAADALSRLARVRLLRAQAGRAFTLRDAAREAVGSDGGLLSSVVARFSSNRAAADRLPDERRPELDAPVLRAIPVVRITDKQRFEELQTAAEAKGSLHGDALAPFLAGAVDMVGRQRILDWAFRDAAERADALIKGVEEEATADADAALAELPDTAREAVLRTELRVARTALRRVEALRSDIGKKVGCRDAALEALKLAADGRAGCADASLRARCEFLSNTRRNLAATIPFGLLNEYVATDGPRGTSGGRTRTDSSLARALKNAYEEATTAGTGLTEALKTQLMTEHGGFTPEQLTGWWVFKDVTAAKDALDVAAAGAEARCAAAATAARVKAVMLDSRLDALVKFENAVAEAEAARLHAREDVARHVADIAADGFTAAELVSDAAVEAAQAEADARAKERDAAMAPLFAARAAALDALRVDGADGAAARLAAAGVPNAGKLLTQLQSDSLWLSVARPAATLARAHSALVATQAEESAAAAAAAAADDQELARAAAEEEATVRRRKSLRDALADAAAALAPSAAYRLRGKADDEQFLQRALSAAEQAHVTVTAAADAAAAAAAAAAEAQRRLDAELAALDAPSAWELARWARLYPPAAAVMAEADAARPPDTPLDEWKRSAARTAAALALVGLEADAPAAGSRVVARLAGKRTFRGDSVLAVLTEFSGADGAHSTAPLARFLTEKRDEPAAAAAALVGAAALLRRLAALGAPRGGVWRAAHAAAAVDCLPLLDALMALAKAHKAERALLCVLDGGLGSTSPAPPLATALRAGARNAVRWLCDAGRACGVAVAADAEAAAPDLNTVQDAVLACASDPAAASELCAALLATGATPSRPNAFGETPLHVATVRGCAPAVRAILTHVSGDAAATAALLVATDVLGRTPLHAALAAAGARTYAKEAAAATADAEHQLELARKRGSKHSAALAAGADRVLELRRIADRYAAECSDGAQRARAEEALAALLAAPGGAYALGVRDGAGRRPLHVASSGPLREPPCALLAAALKSLPADAFRGAVAGCALHALARLPGEAPLLRAALAAGGLANARAADGSLALHVASGRDAAAALLTAHPAGLNAPDERGRTPLYTRAAEDDADAVAVLLAAPGVLAGGAARANDMRAPKDVAGPRTAVLLRAHAAAAAARAEAQQAALRQRRAAAAGTPALAAAALLDEQAVLALATSSADGGEAAWEREGELVRAALEHDLGALRADAAEAAVAYAEEPEVVAEPLAAQTAAADADASDVAELAQLEGRPWEVQCTPEVRAAIAAQQPDLRKRTLRVLLDLADGNWHAASFLSSEGGCMLYKAPISHHSASGLRLLFQAAVEYSPRAGGYVECVRAWTLARHDAFDRALRATQASLRRGARTTVRVHLRLRGEYSPPSVGEAVTPRTFDRVDEPAGNDDAAAGALLVHTPPVDLSQPADPLLRVFTDVSNELAAALLRSGSAAAAGEWPAHVDEAEARLVYAPFDEPMLLLGRSGTGKTTVAVHRMWRLYRQAGVSRFAFVTASGTLRDRVRTLFCRMQRGAGGAVARAADASDALAAAGGPRSLAGTPAAAWPLFLTTAEWLRLQDGVSEAPYFARAPDGVLLHPERAPAAWRPGGASATAAVGAEQPDVDFRVFQRRFWQGLLRELAKAGGRGAAASAIPASACANVWREFVSFIKAGAHADPARAGTPLSREEYVALPHKVAPAFASPEQRAAVYYLFELYERQKAALGVYDAADLVCAIAKAQRERPLGDCPLALAHIFVDEVQDLTQLELLLLVRALARPGGGIFLAGDTAQAVTAGVGFRFEDTKALLYRLASEGRAGAPARWGKPELRALTVNYRAQTGLVNCAAAVGELLVRSFPGAVDALPAERGFFRGRRPVLVRTTEKADIIDLFLPADAGGADVSAFGARQAVLVRSAAARERLAREQPWLADLGATILTVVESKGMEFDVCFLFDFFRDSECDSEWQVIAQAVLDRWDGSSEGSRFRMGGAAAAAARARRELCARHCTQLDRRAHGRLLLELQLLYVALSRGRRRVYVFDTDDVKRAPMFAFLSSPLLVPETGEVTPPVALFSDDVAEEEELTDNEDDEQLDELVGALGAADAVAAAPAVRPAGGSLLAASSGAEWQTQGAAFLANGLFAAAADAFFKAGNHDGGWRATGAELLRRADDAAAAGASARAHALRLRAVRAYAAGHAHADALAAARLAADAQVLAALEDGALAS